MNIVIEVHFAREITERILEWGGTNYQDYTWRKVDNAWLGLLAEVCLQRTKASHVEKYFGEISQLFPTPESVLRASEAELGILSKRYGLSMRIKTLVDLAEYLDVCDYYPTCPEDLTAIYGIGAYTAAAFLSLHMQTRATLVDSNIARWLSRMTDNEIPIDVRRCTWLWVLAESLTPERDYRAYNYAVLDFTITTCKPIKPDCLSCPLEDLCAYRGHLEAGGSRA